MSEEAGGSGYADGAGPAPAGGEGSVRQKEVGTAMNDERRAEGAATGDGEREMTPRVEVATAGEPDAHGTTPAGAEMDLATVRELVLRAHPDVVPELVHGASVDELIASVAPAQSAYQQIVDRVRALPRPHPERGDRTTATASASEAIPGQSPAGTDAAGAPPHVPAGGGVTVVNLDDIPPAEKIARALAGRRVTG
jgi:hypothetical protein